MPNFVNKTSSVFFLILGLAVGVIIVLYVRKKKVEKTVNNTLKDYKTPQGDTPDTKNPESDDEPVDESDE